MKFLLYGLLTVNLLAFLTMGLDKAAAMRGVWRFRESTLLKLAALGGFLGVFLGARVFRHKTIKQPFRRYLYLASLLSIGVISLIAWSLRDA